MNKPVGRQSAINAALTIFVTALTFAFVLLLIRAHAQTAKRDSTLAYELADGPYAVETADQIVRDAKRNKNLPVRVLVPKSDGPFPVFVFSHGAGGSGQNYFPLTWFWATHGYLVIQPTHNDSVALRKEKGEPVPGNPRELVEEYRFNTDDWINRVRDIALILDSL